MAGILFNSGSLTTSSGDTSADAAFSGAITGERGVLSTYPTGTTYSWAIAAPSASTVARSALSSTTTAAPTFTPDVAGEYVITCTVDSTTDYVLRLSVTSTAVSQLVEAIRLSPKTNASVPTPSAGVMLFYSSDENALCVKTTAGAVFTVNLTAT